ncbi:endo alpha-1,4 polygalactosaminidase [Actinomadura keratinilytica]
MIDEDWDEVLLDLSTEELRRAAAARVGRWIDGCAQRGFDAVEPDNYDSFTRSDGLLDAADAQAYLALLVERAHSRGLAVAQKNTAELAGDRKRLGLDFAVAEECGQYEECGVYDQAFDGRVLVVEYTEKGLERPARRRTGGSRWCCGTGTCCRRTRRGTCGGPAEARGRGAELATPSTGTD